MSVSQAFAINFRSVTLLMIYFLTVNDDLVPKAETEPLKQRRATTFY